MQQEQPSTSCFKLQQFNQIQHMPSAKSLTDMKACLQTLPSEYIENQKAVDSALLGGLDAEVKGYLGSRFSLKSADRPHLMKF